MAATTAGRSFFFVVNGFATKGANAVGSGSEYSIVIGNVDSASATL